MLADVRRTQNGPGELESSAGPFGRSEGQLVVIGLDDMAPEAEAVSAGGLRTVSIR